MTQKTESMLSEKSESGFRHPCFSGCASKRFGRVHLPIAAGCNIRCNYCDRRYSCVNENRPGVSANLLPPEEAMAYINAAIAAEPRISVVGIAGPGDPLCRPDTTLPVLREVRRHYPDLLLCLATNGLNLPDQAEDLAACGVQFVTVTVNAVDPEIGARIYSYVNDGKMNYPGTEGAGLLISRQLEGIGKLKCLGVTVKVNTVIIPGINDFHAAEIARKAALLRVDLMNCMAMIPVPGTPFGDMTEMNTQDMRQIRRSAEHFLPQMRHCTRCRADASGMLKTDAGQRLP